MSISELILTKSNNLILEACWWVNNQVQIMILGFLINANDGNYLSFIVITAFIGSAIIVEPKTSPTKTRDQIIYGISMALLILGLAFINVPNSPIIGLMLGNLLYFLYKRSKLRKPVSG